MATRNRAPLLTRALNSAFGQTHAPIEIVVVDDGSDDGTAALLTAWASQGKLRWFRNPVSKGACAARNRAIREARGRYVTGLDDDDEMLPDRIETLLKSLRRDDAFVCASDWLKPPGRASRIRIVPRLIDQPAILARNVAGNQVLAERSKIIACGGFDESLPAGQDYDLWIRMILAHGPARGVSRPKQIIHLHMDGERISRSPARRTGYWMVYRKHRGMMSRQIRSAHLYNLRRANGAPTLLPRDLRFFVPLNRARLIWHWVCDLLKPAET